MSSNAPKHGPSAWNPLPNNVEQLPQTLSTRPWSSTKRIWEEDDHVHGTLPHRPTAERDIPSTQSRLWRGSDPLFHAFENPPTAPSAYQPKQTMRSSSDTVPQHPLQQHEYQFRPSTSNHSRGCRPSYGSPVGEPVLRQSYVTSPQKASSMSIDGRQNERIRSGSSLDFDHHEQFSFDHSKSATGANFERAYTPEYSYERPNRAREMHSRHRIGNYSQAKEGIVPMQAVSYPRDGQNLPEAPPRYRQYQQNSRIEETWRPQNTGLSFQSSEADSHLLHEIDVLHLNAKAVPNSYARTQHHHHLPSGPWRSSRPNRYNDVPNDGYVAMSGLSKHKKTGGSIGFETDHTNKSTYDQNVNQSYNSRPPTPPSSGEQRSRTPRALPENSMDLESLQYGSHAVSQGSGFRLLNGAFYPPGMPPMTNVQAVQQDSKPFLGSRHFVRNVSEDLKRHRGAVVDGDTLCRPLLQSALNMNTLVPYGPGATCRSSGRSRLLEDFKSGHKSGKSYELRDIYNHIVEFSGDQEGSRFIQTKMESANSDEKARIFGEILPNALPLMLDVFGNYIIQKFFEIGEQNQKRLLVAKMRGQMVVLSLHIYGCRAVQKALQFILVEDQACLVRELEHNITRCVKDQNGNHVMQAALEHVPPQHMPFMINTFLGQIKQFSLHVYGCRVVQRLLRYWSEPERSQALEEVHACAKQLISDQYGNYVIQHVLGFEQDEDRQRVIDVVRDDLVNYSKQKFASNVVEKCLTFGDEALREEVMECLCRRDERGHMPLTMMTKDAYGNYVIQKLLDTLNDANCNYFMEKLAPEVVAIKRLPGASKPVEMVAKKMQDRMARPLPSLLPTPPRTADGSRSSSAAQESSSSHGRAEGNAFGGEGQHNPTLLARHPFEPSTARS